MMTTKFETKIIGFSVKKPLEVNAEKSAEKTAEASAVPEVSIEHMHEKVSRPEMLVGATYKIKTPLSDHALYITINDIILNMGTDHEVRRPFEIFINSKNMDQFQWVLALTRVISAVFRKGGDVTFLTEELKAVFDPQGGYFKSGGRFMPSLVAEIGDTIETHLKMIGLIKTEVMHPVQQQILAEKKAEYDAKKGTQTPEGEFPPTASLCMKCHTKAMILMDGCITCLNCGDSKCG